MAESDVSAVKVFNFICSRGGFAEFSQLLKPPSPLAKKSDASSVILWFEKEKLAGSFVSGHRLVMTKNLKGLPFGFRIDLKTQICLKYCLIGSCNLARRCKFWHICKGFLDGTCKGVDCGSSHDFHDDDNERKTAELEFENKSNAVLRSVIAGSLLQVCLSYLKNECATFNCPYLHVCTSLVVSTPGCECRLSHDFADTHNKNILEQFGFKPPRTSNIDVVRCNILVPKQQKPIEDNKRLLELAQANQNLSHFKERESLSRQTKPGTRKTEISGKDQTYSKITKDTKPAVTLSGLIREANKASKTTSAPPPQEAVPSEADPLAEKVFNYICGKGGLATFSDLLRHPSPLAKKFSAPEQVLDAKIWLQVQAQLNQIPRLCLLENGDGDLLGVQIKLKKKMCLHYASKGSCAKPVCQFWHVCKGYLEGKCPGNCGLSHDFHDGGNIKNVERLGLEKHPSGTVKNIVANSLPQVCLNYLNNECLSSSCPYLHICCPAAQGNPCSCDTSHELTCLDAHNIAILRKNQLVPQADKLNIVLSNILVPKQQKRFEEVKPSASSPLVPSSQTNPDKFGSHIPSLMTLPLKPDLQASEKSCQEKGKRQRTRKRQRQKKQQGEQKGGPEGLEEDGSDSNSDNEDMEKPDLYSSSKFGAYPSKQESGEHQFSGIYSTEAVEENLINLSDDEWQAVNDPMDNFSASNYELLSQVDEMFFDDWFGSSNIAGSLSQPSGISFSPDNSTDDTETSISSEKSRAASVFQCICKEYNGQVAFSEISQRQDLFSSDVLDIAAWFKGNSNKFMTIENKDGEIEAVRAFSPRARICFRYLLTKNGCKNPKCYRYHVCNHYLANGVCPFGKKCRYSHSHNLRSPHNKKITSQLKFKALSEDQLRILISASVPDVCLDYNTNACRRGFRCNGIHICKKFVMKQCKKGDECPFNHQSSLGTPEATLVLGRYNLSKIPSHAVLGALLVRQPPESLEKPAVKHQTIPRPPFICLDNLLGHCTKRSRCSCQHYDMPYLWQYKLPAEDGDNWRSFTTSDNEDIERKFCDVNVTDTILEHITISTPPSVLIDPGEGEVKLYFDDMKAETGFGDVQLRRLSTKSAASPTDHALSTQWVWYWLNEITSWIEYGNGPMETVTSQQIESGFTKGKPFFGFHASDKSYHKILFQERPMCQKSTKPPKTTVKVRRRPVFRSISEVQRFQRPLEMPIPLLPESPFVTTDAPTRIPPDWTTVPDDADYIRVPLPSGSDQFKLTESLFRRSLSENKATILAIERVQNPFMWEKYARKKEKLEKRSRTKNSPVNEKLLFHGTDHQNVDSVCEENIDWRTQDEGRAASFGEGAYFTEEAALSNLYCKQDSESVRYMFLAEVLVGSFAKGEPLMKRPPQKSDDASKKELYDSCVDKIDKPTIYVLFNSDQYYPTFLIRYKIKSKVVC